MTWGWVVRPVGPRGVLRRQLEAASGVLGSVTGIVVARLTAEANRWVVDLLDVQLDDRVVDIGCGPGVAVAAAAARAPRGVVVGVDGSAAMVRQARRRNRSAVREGRVEIREADAARLPFPDAQFTEAASVNSLQFWPSPQAGLQDLYRVLEPGGRAAVVLMARSDDPPPSGRAPSHAWPPWIGSMGQTMRAVGFREVSCRGREFGGVLHWALLAHR